MPPAARVGDMHTCSMITGVVQEAGVPILPRCFPTALIGNASGAMIRLAPAR